MALNDDGDDVCIVCGTLYSWQEDVLSWLRVIVADAKVTADQEAEIIGGFTDLLVNHFGED